ncbi:hypothetical protein SAMN05428949_2076 [Chitinophaga sp. YR627]|nr:hypothetical protein SAMN05428949_2076 [Chitinophaga sp. YR627]
MDNIAAYYWLCYSLTIVTLHYTHVQNGALAEDKYSQTIHRPIT